MAHSLLGIRFAIQWVMIKWFLLMFSIAVLGAVGCQKPASDNSPSAIESEYFVNGDPLEIVQGTDLNSVSFLTKENYQDFDQIEISGSVTFMERSKKTSNPENMDEVKKDNKTPVDLVETPDLSSSFSIQKNSEGRDDLHLTIGQKKDLVLIFRDPSNTGKFELKALKSKETEHPIQALHYSVNPEKTAFSVLFLAQDQEDKGLLGLSFHKKAAALKKMEVTAAAKNYFYLFGKGVLVGQDAAKPLIVSVCGKDGIQFRSQITESIRSWQNALKDRLEISLKFEDKCKPILDVNAQTIQFIENRITRVASKFFNPGSTFPRASFSSAQLVGANILIFKGEYKRVLAQKGDVDYANYLSTSIGKTMIHEFGHLLGLGHPFESQSPSIMGYDGVSQLTSFDVSSVQMLYPLKAKEDKP